MDVKIEATSATEILNEIKSAVQVTTELKSVMEMCNVR